MLETGRELNKVYQSTVRNISHERDAYPFFRMYYLKRGFHHIRIEGCPSVPDIWVGREDDYRWIEVKVYRGNKPLEKLELEDIKELFKPGQLRFRAESLQKCRGHYKLAVFNLGGAFTWVED